MSIKTNVRSNFQKDLITLELEIFKTNKKHLLFVNFFYNR